MNKDNYILQQRWYDSQWKTWTDWKELDAWTIDRKYGVTPEAWKKSCQAWIDVGGTYEYRIVKRTDVLEWELSYLKDKQLDDIV